jgi:hypothetical protein
MIDRLKARRTVKKIEYKMMRNLNRLVAKCYFVSGLFRQSFTIIEQEELFSL